MNRDEFAEYDFYFDYSVSTATAGALTCFRYCRFSLSS
jgi:hypothetical protein